MDHFDSTYFYCKINKSVETCFYFDGDVFPGFPYAGSCKSRDFFFYISVIIRPLRKAKLRDKTFLDKSATFKQALMFDQETANKWILVEKNVTDVKMLFVFFFSSFLGRLDCAGKPFVPVAINLSDHRDEEHRNAQRK